MAVRRGLRMPAPMSLATELERRFGKLSTRAQALALRLLGPSVEANDPAAIERALTEIEATLANEFTQADFEADALSVGSRVDRNHQRAFFGALAIAAGVTILGKGDDALPPLRRGTRGRKPVLAVKLSAEPKLLAAQFARSNALRITTLRREIVPALRDEIVRAVQFGVSPDAAAARLAAKWKAKGIPIARGDIKPRLRLITRDQVAKLNAQITESRQRASGVTRFKWVSQQDDDVRELHEQIDGQIFPWATGHPTEGKPGEPIACRCIAEAIVERDQVLRSPAFIHLAEVAA